MLSGDSARWGSVWCCVPMLCFFVCCGLGAQSRLGAELSVRGLSRS